VKVLVVHSRYLTGNVSGENRVVEDEVELLRRGGHEVISWTPSFDLTRGIGAAVDVVWSRSAASHVGSLLAREMPDVMHVHNLFPVLSPAILRPARAVGAPVVMTLQNFRLTCLPATLLRDGRICEDCLGKLPWRGVLHGCYRDSRAASAALALSLAVHRAAHTFDCVTTFAPASDFLRDKLARAGIDRQRMRTRPNFAWETATREGAGDYFLFLGRLSVEKGVDTLTTTWGGRRRLLVVGDGPERERLRATSRPGVEFHQPVPPEELGPLLRNARALVLPSRWYEGWPRVAVEALAAGVPIVASDIGGLPELVVDGESGLLVPPDEPAAWMNAIRRLDDDAVSERLGSGAHTQWKERFSPEVGLRSLEELYRWTVALHRSSTSVVPAL
jgi:glycosyltransferase involved in cell wall biosynthesis